MSRRKLIQKVMKNQAQNVDASSLLTKKGGLTPPPLFILDVVRRLKQNGF